MRRKRVTAILMAWILGIMMAAIMPCQGFTAKAASESGIYGRGEFSDKGYSDNSYDSDYADDLDDSQDEDDTTDWDDWDDWEDEDDEDEPDDEISDEEYAREHWYDNEQPEANISSKDQAPDGKGSVKGTIGKPWAELTEYNAVRVTVREAEVTEKEVGKYIYGSSQFYLYRAESPKGPFSCVKGYGRCLDYRSGTYYLDDYDLKRDTTYYYKVRQKYVGYIKQESYWEGKGKKTTCYFDSSVISITTLADKEVLCRLSLTKPGTAVISWNRLGYEVENYTIYRAEGSKKGTYEPIKTIKTDNGSWYEDTNYEYKDKTLEYGKKYFYKISAHTNFGLDTPCNVIKNVVSGPDKVVIKKMKCPKSGEITLEWKKVDKATGYIIYRSTDNFKFKKVKDIKNPDTVTASITGLKHGEIYYFKVRAYDKSKSATLWGIENEPSQKTMDYYLCPYSDISRDQRFGNLDFKTQSQADRQMKTIKIKTWDINKATNQKYTRYFYLTVHKNAAPTVEKIFNEIYNGKEKFPIHSIGGYAWRSDDSTSEHHYGLAIDINSNENWMPSRNVGSYWRPGKDPYSITPDGDVVTIMNKYGFYWLGEYDAMHFSVSGT